MKAIKPKKDKFKSFLRMWLKATKAFKSSKDYSRTKEKKVTVE